MYFLCILLTYLVILEGKLSYSSETHSLKTTTRTKTYITVNRTNTYLCIKFITSEPKFHRNKEQAKMSNVTNCQTNFCIMPFLWQKL